jgi:DNA mismatch endonuclease (patch repair protein)
MPDVFTKEKRSEVMSKIRGCGNKKTELALIKVFKHKKITGWRRNSPVYGKPDFVFPKKRTAVFVDGCFWHRCPKCDLKPKQNALFWQQKLDGNRERDKKVNRVLKRKGWKILRIWECELKKANKSGFKLNRLRY